MSKEREIRQHKGIFITDFQGKNVLQIDTKSTGCVNEELDNALEFMHRLPLTVKVTFRNRRI